LAPAVVAEVLAAIERLRDKTSILLVEHKVDLVLDYADRAYTYIMINGQIAYTGDSEVPRDDMATQAKFLGVG
jgi:ABC-type branched-subunit amino acid transport system ATPase component